MNITNYIPAPKSVELQLSPSPEFSRYSKKVKALGGRYNECRGNAYRRFVTLPWTDEGRELANKLVAEFGTGSLSCGKTTLIVRGDETFRNKHVHAWVIVHKINRSDANPCGTLLAKYEDAFLKAFPDAVNPEPVKPVVEIDEDEQPVSITLTKAQARVVLAALSRRCLELETLGGWEAKTLGDEAKEIYRSVDKQTYGEHAAC